VKVDALALNWTLVGVLLVLSIASFVLVVASCAPLLLKEFYPSFSALTFPFVIASVAYTLLSKSLLPVLAPVATALQVLATFMVIFVSIRFLIFLLRPQK
jgi:exfoliative toxin A/B